jgi:cytoskeleton protein RodZ
LSEDRTSPGRGTPAPSDPTPLGPALAAAREARGLSVEDVAAATRIRATLVRGIESDDFARCGGAVYARGHIKSIAQVVGADPRALVAEFDRRYGDPAPTVTASPLPAFESPSEGRRPTARWASMAVAVLVVATVFFAFSWLLGRDPGPDVSASPGPSATVTAPPPSSKPPTTTPPKVTTPRPAPAGVTLRVRASDADSWLLVTASSGIPMYQGVLAVGQQMDFRDGRSLTVKFGNSRGVRLTLNGQDIGAPRCDSIVCSVEFLPPRAAAG